MAVQFSREQMEMMLANACGDEALVVLTQSEYDRLAQAGPEHDRAELLVQALERACKQLVAALEHSPDGPSRWAVPVWQQYFVQAAHDGDVVRAYEVAKEQSGQSPAKAPEPLPFYPAGLPRERVQEFVEQFLAASPSWRMIYAVTDEQLRDLGANAPSSPEAACVGTPTNSEWAGGQDFFCWKCGWKTHCEIGLCNECSKQSDQVPAEVPPSKPQWAAPHVDEIKFGLQGAPMAELARRWEKFLDESMAAFHASPDKLITYNEFMVQRIIENAKDLNLQACLPPVRHECELDREGKCGVIEYIDIENPNASSIPIDNRCDRGSGVPLDAGDPRSQRDVHECWRRRLGLSSRKIWSRFPDEPI